ncbi:GFA family protein, partial [Myxococcota bacterium]|nr:GFA family protein [Myxococcota bacterium]
GQAAIDFRPKILRIVGARELRWVSEIPGDPPSRAEHYLILTPTVDGGTHFENTELFEGPIAEAVWPMMEGVGRRDFEQMNRDLKNRAELLERASVALHPALPSSPRSEASSTAEVGRASARVVDAMILRCACEKAPVEVRVDAQPKHPHLCGCSQCWKPAGAVFALIAVAPAGSVRITAGADALAVVDPTKAIARSACRRCGVHMIGRVADPDHHFYGLDFFHPELAVGACPAPEFAGFVSSIIEAGASPSRMAAIRRQLAALGIPAWDSFSPELMDLIAWHRLKIARSREAIAVR